MFGHGNQTTSKRIEGKLDAHIAAMETRVSRLERAWAFARGIAALVGLVVTLVFALGGCSPKADIDLLDGSPQLRDGYPWVQIAPNRFAIIARSEGSIDRAKVELGCAPCLEDHWKLRVVERPAVGAP